MRKTIAYVGISKARKLEGGKQRGRGASRQHPLAELRRSAHSGVKYGVRGPETFRQWVKNRSGRRARQMCLSKHRTLVKLTQPRLRSPLRMS